MASRWVDAFLQSIGSPKITVVRRSDRFVSLRMKPVRPLEQLEQAAKAAVDEILSGEAAEQAQNAQTEK